MKEKKIDKLVSDSFIFYLLCFIRSDKIKCIMVYKHYLLFVMIYSPFLFHSSMHIGVVLKTRES
jgi:hypothetical protein